MSVGTPRPSFTRAIRVGMLVVIALVALANALGWVDADLWIPFVCIIAVMGIGTRGAPVDALGFVLIEAAVVCLLGVATFSSSRDAVWAASVAVSVLAIGKIALVELHRLDIEGGSAGAERPAGGASAKPAAPPVREHERPAPPLAPSEPAPAPMSPGPESGARGPRDETEGASAEGPAREPIEAPSESLVTARPRRSRDDPTPKSVRLER
jgi:hypothetical protein